MNDTYVECLIEKKKSMVTEVVKWFLIVLALALLILGFMGATLFISVAMILGLCVYFIQMMSGTEYEYLYVDKTLSIDKITAKRKRKRIAVYELERMEICAPEGDYRLADYKNRNCDTKDYSSQKKENADQRYIMYFDGQKKLIFEPSPKLLNAMFQVAPRKVMLKK